MLLLAPTMVQAQIKIGGNVYGGGNAGTTGGKTSVTIHAGDLKNVYGGARQADIGKSTFVHVDGEHISGDITINAVYGGNDIAGTIGMSESVPAEMSQADANGVTEANSFLLTTPERTQTTTTGEGDDAVTTTTPVHQMFIGQLFGGGNGDYTYTADGEGTYTVKDGDVEIATKANKPELAKSYLELLGGTFGYVYGGGNNVTVTEKTDICIDNSSTPMQGNSHLTLPASIDLTQLSTELAKPDNQRLMDMGINITTFERGYNFLRVFGGNNKAPMSIRPIWHFGKGSIINLYSGGNEGPMTSEHGLLLVIGEDAGIKVKNVYGGCRKADVHPMYADGSGDVAVSDIQLPGTDIDPTSGKPYKFPSGFSARMLIRGGQITNIYGGNDISGKVYGGNAIGVYTSISGDVYGGGNGSYAYTDNNAFAKDILWGDFYYDPGTNSLDALNAFRPNAEQVSIRVWGKDAAHKTVIGGSIYVGGNSATLSSNPAIPTPLVHLKVGSNVIADNVFLGNNGKNMVNPEDGGVLWQYRQKLYPQVGTSQSSTLVDFSSIDLTDKEQFAKYMEGCAMNLLPSVVFDDSQNGDPEDYQEFSTYFGSFFCGGNVGSMTKAGKETINFSHKIVIYDKVVGGCNNANVAARDGLNAAYKGGLVGAPDGEGNKLELTFSGLKIQPKRWNADHTELIWNTISAQTKEEVTPTGLIAGTSTDADLDRRLKGGNVYGGCYNSGHVNGNVVININASVIDRHEVFDVVEYEEGEPKLYESSSFNITQRNSGVILDKQGMDVLGGALNVFGGGYGEDSEIWGSTNINLNKGYVFQVFGGGEKGAIGKKNNDGTYTYNETYSTHINMNGTVKGEARDPLNTADNLAEAEFIYGGGFEGPVLGSTHLYLGNGRLFNSFAGSCNADIYGHTETYVGKNRAGDAGFPWVRDHVYGGNDLGGQILNSGDADFTEKVSEGIRPMIYNTNNPKAAAYMEYTRGRVENIFGGAYGDYDYTDRIFAAYTNDDGTVKGEFHKPYLKNAFVHFKPDNFPSNYVSRIYGAGQGHHYTVASDLDRDKSQDRSYVLIDIPEDAVSPVKNFITTAVFGAGDYSGVGIGVDKTTADENANGVEAAAVIDLMSGEVGNVYGGSYQEGFTRRTIVNVPKTSDLSSTIKAKNIFGGAFGLSNTLPCDVYEATVNHHSGEARLTAKELDKDGKINYIGSLYGGNNNARRTFYGTVNVDAPLVLENGYSGTVYGAGLGENCWSQYTEVNLNGGANVWEVYGGGRRGKVVNTVSLDKWKEEDGTLYTDMPAGYTDEGLESTLAHNNQLDTDFGTKYPQYHTKHNTNVHIREGAVVGSYAYGGGLGTKAINGSGDVYGTTYIDLLGGTVKKDLYAAGTSGDVKNIYSADFTASTHAYVQGGTARNVYGGGWEGSVGKHEGGLAASTADDIPGVTHVVIGKPDGTSFVNGIPAIERNAYGGGEGGAVFGTTNLLFNNGYIGYRYFANESDLDKHNGETVKYFTETKVGWTGYYQEKLHDETWTQSDGTDRLKDSGCIFGGGYVDNSSVDITNVTMLGGKVRNSLFGGGEIAAIGRGVVDGTGAVRVLKGIYKAGKTHVKLYGGHVMRDVFGGGRGYNNLGEGGTLYSDGYVFGQTEVKILGGEVGTEEGIAESYGNVFGGGDIGYVYSAYEKEDGTMVRGVQQGQRYDDADEGYYYESINGEIQTSESEKILTEDCKVLVEPHCLVKAAVTINGNDYNPGDYVPTDDLNTLKKKTEDTRWSSLDDFGIIIHNAVFAGGNVAVGSSKEYANAVTVFGNATASIHDIYHRDLITVGTGHNGGLYGDGNLTFVDGYRGLNITNYGTDYYNIKHELTLEQYNSLKETAPREAAYYELKYTCLKACTDSEGTNYHPKTDDTSASTIAADELMTLFEGVKDGEVDIIIIDGDGKKVPNPEYWEASGVCSRYAGRIMNTIQRADFCGVFGSRMVMQGARDRVPEKADFKNYTINRVREVSLNKKSSTAGDAEGSDGYQHGNYFGIYNIVNYLGNLTSDVDFGDADGNGDKRTSDNKDTSTYGADGKTFYQWKEAHHTERKRNNGNSHNQVALASGVYLEITREKSELVGDTIWGHITGVIELDLINVQAGVGGGFVYAKNEHGKRSKTNLRHITLTALNQNAVTRKDYQYSTDENKMVDWETSGNFVHSEQIIIDDCYPISNRYKGEGKMPAHYWYIKGQVYVYDQYISAYTGTPNAYSESVYIPLTITAASNGTMKLMDVQPNLYAYYNNDGTTKLTDNQKIEIKGTEYHLNDPISYWDYNLLSTTEKRMFVEKTYVVIADCKLGDTEYKQGEVMLPDEYNTLRGSGAAVTYEENGVVKNDKDFDYFFRLSNNISHSNGYILTYDVNNPGSWDKWYTPVTAGSGETPWLTDKKSKADYKNESGYEDGPTYRLTSGTAGMLGQREYKVADVISDDIYQTYQAIATDPSWNSALTGVQAIFQPAYIVTTEMDAVKTNGTSQHLNKNVIIVEQDYNNWSSMSSHTAPAYICTKTIALSQTEYIYLNSYMTKEDKDAYYDRFKDGSESDKIIAREINEYVVPAYYCTTPGLYGGDYYEGGKNYRGLKAWSSMSPADREKFSFNYDALDLLIDESFSKNSVGQRYQYDGEDYTTSAHAGQNPARYSLACPVDYTATYNGETITEGGITLEKDKEYTRVEFEQLPNEQRHWAAFTPKEDDPTVYIVKEEFSVGNSIYAVGTTTTKDIYDAHTSNVEKVTGRTAGETYYYCREAYGSRSVGEIIESSVYETLPNYQKNFTIHGVAPKESATFYVSRNADINDLSTEKIITVVYRYDYEESDVTGLHITPVSERHVVNIHINFKSGVPDVESIAPPLIVLPGNMISMTDPKVTPGAYEVMGGGWELFETESDAESHTNGVDFTPNNDPLYWYQNGYYVAYYAKTYLGKTYSNHVPVSVANYHDLKKVMDAPLHHYYIDHKNVDREPKIYINDYTADNKNGLDLFRDLIDLTNGTTVTGHTSLVTDNEGKELKGGKYLEFFLRTNIDHTEPWTPIAQDEGKCFEGTLHGDGHTIAGLNNSLFGHLCGSVYNLGVTGTFTSAGVADTGDGYVENCWINTNPTGTLDSEKRAVLGDPTGSGTQIRNCYYPETLGYSTTDNGRGLARPMPLKSFYNGEVAYNLNDFYLYKRYFDNKPSALGSEPHTYYYFVDGTDGLGNAELQLKKDGKYSKDYHQYYEYVEKRFEDGDFIYAGGTIPETADIRQYVEGSSAPAYYPIWPDDYLFFGQALNYGHIDGRTHQEQPSVINRMGSRVLKTIDGNRVYRAPAYFKSKEMKAAHFNPYAVFAQTKKDDANTIAYKDMTAIDFTGYGDTEYKEGYNGSGKNFFQPLLDDDGLSNFRNIDLTKNLLVYTGTAAPAVEATNDVVSSYLVEPEYRETDIKYRTVDAQDTRSIFGHWVQLSGGSYQASRDHLLVDKHDFNAPISYSFTDDKRMWYQRTPDLYVGLDKGWETVSLPFSAELVTTQQKGEITHFYSGSYSVDANGTKVGHEYWLREYNGEKDGVTSPEGIFTAAFNYPTASGDKKTVTNTFLWDYYYEKNTQQDRNQDTYQTYYSDDREYTQYPLLGNGTPNGTPYIIGFPGKTYYEFDLSGEWEAKNTASPTPERLDQQVITFASVKNTTIGVSDDEMTEVAHDGYSFVPNYLNESIAAGEGYLMNSEGSRFDKTTTPTATVPFRPYFTTAASGSRQAARAILFDGEDSSFAIGDDRDPSEEEIGGGLLFTIRKHEIAVTSSLNHEADVRIVNVGGVTIANFTIQPGETIERYIPIAGVYIIRADNGRIQKKIALK